MPKKTVIKKSALSPTVLIAGGAGFIGSHLASVFLNNGARVLVLDNFKTGKEIHVTDLVGNPNFALYDCDINTGLPVEIESVDYVVHLAGLEEYLYTKDFIDLNTLLTNSVGTKNLLDFSFKSQAKFLLVSSIDIYQGRMSQMELNEYFGKSTLEENKYMVTEAKRYAEALVWEYFKRNKLDARIIRLPEVYGPRMSLDASGSLGRFIRDLVEGRNLTIYGEGDDAEIYLYVDDAVSGIVKSLFTRDTSGNIYSLCSSAPMKDVELAYIVKSLADRELIVNFVSKGASGGAVPNAIKPDIFNLKDLEWNPRVDIKEGLSKTLAWLGYQSNTQSFKPAKFIADKKKKVQPETREDDVLFSLQGIKESDKSFESIVVPVKKQDVIKSNVVATANTSVIKTKPFSFFTREIHFGFLPKLSSIKLPLAVTSKASLILGVSAVLISLVIIFAIVPISLSLFHSYRGASYLEAAGKHVATLDSSLAKENARVAYKHFYSAKKAVSGSGFVFNLVGKREFFNTYTRTLGSLAYFSKAAYTLADAVKPFESLWEIVRPDTAAEIDPQIFADAKLKINAAKLDVQLAEADLKYVNKALLPERIQPKIAMYDYLLSELSANLDYSEKLVGGIPEVLGADKEKKYLLLFQNNNEVRATGGFIGSYGLLTLSKGKISNLEIDDIYNPDGQIDLRNIKEPVPAQIEEYLKEDRMHIRNANWSPDFVKSADAITNLYYKVSGQNIDGVVALDLEFVREFLDVTGPVYLTAYNEEIRADNLYERTQFHSDFNYVNGSDQKKSFLTILGSKLLERFFSLPKEQMSSLADMLLRSIEQRHLMVTLKNSSLSGLLSEMKWDGTLVETDTDYLAIINSNIGGTKANYFVKNNYQYKVTSQTRDGLLRGIVTLNYDHTGTDGAWPGGPYTDYVRVITQAGTKLTGATIQLQKDTVPVDIMKDIIVGTEGSYQYFGYTFVLDPKNTAILKISYDLPQGLSVTKDAKEYNLYWQKQSGSNQDPIELEIDYPFGMEVIDRTNGFVYANDIMSIRTNLKSDREFFVKLK